MVLGVTTFQNDLLCIATSFSASSILTPLRSSMSGAGRKSGVKATFSPASLPKVSKTLRLSAEKLKVGKWFLGNGLQLHGGGLVVFFAGLQRLLECLCMCLFCLAPACVKRTSKLLLRRLIGRDQCEQPSEILPPLLPSGHPLASAARS